MQDTYSTIEEHLDLTLAKLCLDLDMKMYKEVFAAYESLGRRHAICDRLGSHFITAIHEASHAAARGDEGGKSASRRPADLGMGHARQSQFKALCGKLPPAKFESCLVDICEAMCRIMIAFNKMVEEHAVMEESGSAITPEDSEDADDAGPDESSTDPTAEETAAAEAAAAQPFPSTSSAAPAPASASAETITPREYELMKFEVHRGRIWQDAQRQVATYMLEVELSVLPLNTFLQLLGHVRRFVSIGEDFSEHKSPQLEKVIRQKSLTYFWDSHKRMLETLQDQINRDLWVGMAVVKDFNIFFLKEYSFLRKTQKAGGGIGDGDGGEYSGVGGQLKGFVENDQLFRQNRLELAEKDSQSITFERPKPKKQTSVTEDDGDDTPPEGGGAAVATPTPTPTPKAADGPPPPVRPPPPHCSEACMLVVRCFGKYLQMMDVLKAISGEIFESMVELYYYYVDSVWGFFVRSGKLTYQENVLSGRAGTTLARLAKAKAAPPDTIAPSNPDETTRPNLLYEMAKSSPPTLAAGVDLVSDKGLHGLGARVTAVESLTFLATVLRSLRPNFQKRLPSSRARFVDGFYDEMVSPIPELRWLIYKNGAATLLPLAPIVKMISSVKWDPKEILSDHNKYVDELIASVNSLAGKIRRLGEASLPQVAYDSVWTEITHEINVMFVNGYSNTKKCTMEGRALMQLDYRQYLSKLAKVCTVKPNTEHVDIFIRAFYLQEEELEPWLREQRKRYAKQQLTNVIQVQSVKLDKKIKTKMLKFVEELYMYNS
jgi:hypothetical protein